MFARRLYVMSRKDTASLVRRKGRECMTNCINQGRGRREQRAKGRVSNNLLYLAHIRDVRDEDAHNISLHE